MSWIKKHKWKLLLALVLLLTASIYLADLTVVNCAKGKTFNDVNDMPFNKVGMLLGTSKYVSSGQPNQYFANRIEAAAQLYKSGKIKYILVSGDNSTKYYDEPAAMRKSLIAAGVDSTHIVADDAGLRTFDSVIRAKEIFGQSSLTIISQKFHNERAIYFAEKNGINAVGFNAKDVDKYYGFKTNLREKLARVNAVLDFWFGAKPRFLGEKIPLD
jgi:SanA protein